MQSVTVGKHSARLSSTGKYLILDDDNGHLYVRTDVAAPHYCAPSGGPSVTYTGTTYTQHAPVRQFLRDCLHTAEEIIWNQALATGQIRSKVGATPFGNSHDENIALVNALRAQAGVNRNASPDTGQAYALVSTIADSTYPYHAGGVLATDGEDRVTVEVFAGADDARDNQRQEPGTFRMYSMTAGETFHDMWCDGVFAYTNPVTVVLVHI